MSSGLTSSYAGRSECSVAKNYSRDFCKRIDDEVSLAHNCVANYKSCERRKRVRDLLHRNVSDSVADGEKRMGELELLEHSLLSSRCVERRSRIEADELSALIEMNVECVHMLVMKAKIQRKRRNRLAQSSTDEHDVNTCRAPFIDLLLGAGRKSCPIRISESRQLFS